MWRQVPPAQLLLFQGEKLVSAYMEEAATEHWEKFCT